MVDKKLSEFSQITTAEIAKLICLYLDQNNAIKNGVVDFATLDALLAHKAGTETFTGNKTFSGDTVFSGDATFNNTVNANVSGSSGSCTGNSATATKATQDESGNNIANTYATKTELSNKVDLNLNNMNPSATAKGTIVGWGMPDYSTAISVTTNTYTAPYDGVITGYIEFGDKNNTTDVTINGTKISFIRGWPGSYAGTTNNVFFTLSKGDVVVGLHPSGLGVASYVVFSKLKGANNA